jgi:hypothetical protein
MLRVFDIFREFPEGGPIWVEAVQGLENAKSRLDELTRTDRGDYFLFDPASAKIIAVAPTMIALHPTVAPSGTI